MERLHLSITNHSTEPRLSRQVSWSEALGRGLRFENRRTRLIVESILLGLAVAFAVWFSTPVLTRDYINRSLANLPDYTGRVESVRIHPWTASLDLYDLRIDKKSGAIPVHFLYSPRCTVSLQGSQILHGAARSSMIMYDAQINLVSGPTPEQSQFFISETWFNAVKRLIPWRINQIRIHHGVVHYRDFQADPPIDLEISQLEVASENMTNSLGLKIPLPSTAKISGRPLLA